MQHIHVSGFCGPSGTNIVASCQRAVTTILSVGIHCRTLHRAWIDFPHYNNVNMYAEHVHLPPVQTMQMAFQAGREREMALTSSESVFFLKTSEETLAAASLGQLHDDIFLANDTQREAGYIVIPVP